jgi:hypothetical protein
MNLKHAVSTLVRRRAAHQSDDLVGGHPEITSPAQLLNEPLAARFATGLPWRLDQTDHASIDLELDVRAWHEAGPFTHRLRNGHLALGCDPQERHLSYPHL